GFGHDCSLGCGDKNQIGLYDIEVGQDDIIGRDEDLAQGMLAKKVRQGGQEHSSYALMLGIGRRRHDMFSIDQLMAFPIVRDKPVVFVCQSQMTGLGRHMHLTPCSTRACGHLNKDKAKSQDSQRISTKKLQMSAWER